MTDIFQVRPGQVVQVVADSSSAPRLLTLFINKGSGGPVAPPVEIGIVQGTTFLARTQTQKQLGMNRGIFVTPFGDQVGQLQLQTILNVNCNGQDPIGNSPLKKFFDFYNGFKLTPSANLEPLYLGLGGVVLRGYLGGMQLNSAAQQSQVHAGTLTFDTITTGA